jgi:ABC-type proline/glycine betaine transport system substrate-binding protein
MIHVFFIFRPDQSFLDKNDTLDCDFPYNHLKKFAWSKVKSGAPEFYHVLEKLYLTKKQLNLLLRQHKDAGGTMSSYDAACYWLQQTRNVWLSWLPSDLHTGKIPVFLGGMFPMDEKEGALWVRPGILEGE